MNSLDAQIKLNIKQFQAYKENKEMRESLEVPVWGAPGIEVPVPPYPNQQFWPDTVEFIPLEYTENAIYFKVKRYTFKHQKAAQFSCHLSEDDAHYDIIMIMLSGVKIPTDDKGDADLYYLLLDAATILMSKLKLLPSYQQAKLGDFDCIIDDLTTKEEK